MSIRATVVEITGDNEIGRGEFDFLQLPQRGDHVVLGHLAGLQLMSVLKIEHSPAKANPLIKTKGGVRVEPWVTVFVELLDLLPEPD